MTSTRPATRSTHPVEVPSPRATAIVAGILVTWNRKELVSAVIEALSAQAYPLDRFHLVVVDNASTDGTSRYLARRWRPERIVANSTDRAHEPAFEPPSRPEQEGPNLAGFASLSIVANRVNLGGCGGFNTGFAFVERVLPSWADAEPDFLWLLDDDIDLPADALRCLVAAADDDPRIGLVGSRTVHLQDRRTTIESTIYFDRATGFMGPDPAAGHPMVAEHRRWITTTGTNSPKGDGAFTGVRPVDVVSACSMLARWSAVKEVGFWDQRYFIYCDDADWCLRFGRAGYGVVLNLDAVVYHTPWLSKLTPSRAYYADRNSVWMLAKVLGGAHLRRVTWSRLRAFLLGSLKAGLLRRGFQGELRRRTVEDIVRSRGGRLRADLPPPESVLEAFERARCLGPGARVLVMCNQPESVRWADRLRASLTHSLISAGRADEQPRWTYFVRNDVPDPQGTRGGGGAGAAGSVPERIVYSMRWQSKIRRQIGLLRRPPSAVVVFNLLNDVPLVRGGRFNIHVDTRTPDRAQVERDTIGSKLAFLARWACTAVAARVYARRLKPHRSSTKYG